MITPAIIPTSLQHLKEAVSRLPVARCQIDVVDGRFTPYKSWPYEPKGQVVDAADIVSGIKLEIDLMVEEPEKAAADWLSVGAETLVFHIESLVDPKNALTFADDFDVEIAFAVGNDTPLEAIYPYIGSLDFVQLMGIKNIGAQAEPFDDRVLDRVVELSSLFPTVPISVDGGVNARTIKSLKDAGAVRFVVGSAIQNATDPANAYQELLKIIA